MAVKTKSICVQIAHYLDRKNITSLMNVWFSMELKSSAQVNLWQVNIFKNKSHIINFEECKLIHLKYKENIYFVNPAHFIVLVKTFTKI